MTGRLPLSAWCNSSYAKPDHDRCQGLANVHTGAYEASPTGATLRPVYQQEPCRCTCHEQAKLW